MSYEKQNFKTGQVLTAEHLNHMEDGISKSVRAYEEWKLISSGVGTQETLKLSAAKYPADGKYIVVFDGVEYETTVRSGQFSTQPMRATFLGVAPWDVNSENPFSLYKTGNASAPDISSSEVELRSQFTDIETHTVEVYMYELTKINPLFLPDNVFLIDTTSAEFSLTDAAYGDKVKEAILSGKTVYSYVNGSYGALKIFNPKYTTDSGTYLSVVTNNNSFNFTITL